MEELGRALGIISGGNKWDNFYANFWRFSEEFLGKFSVETHGDFWKIFLGE